MKKLIVLVALSAMLAGCVACNVAPIGDYWCEDDEDCPVGYLCRPVKVGGTDKYCLARTTFYDGSVFDTAVVDGGVSDTATAPDTATADTFVPVDASQPDTTTAPDTATADTAVADVIPADAGVTDLISVDTASADSADANVVEDAFVPEDAGTPDTMGECTGSDHATCVALYGADHFCWDSQCVLANASNCGPFRATVYKAMGYDFVRIRTYGTSGFIREFNVPNGTYESQVGECSWLIFEADGAFGGCATVYGSSPFECSTSSCPPDGWRCRWDQS